MNKFRVRLGVYILVCSFTQQYIYWALNYNSYNILFNAIISKEEKGPARVKYESY